MKTATTLFFFLISGHLLLAQLPDSVIGQVTVHFQGGVPYGDFADKMDDNAYGFDAGYLHRFGQSPILAGVSFDYLHFSRYKIDVDDPIGQTGFNNEYDWITASQAMFFSAAIRVQPALKAPLRPYFQGNIGARRLFTATRLQNRNGNDDSNFRNDVEVADWAVFYSGKAGLQFILTKDQMLALDLGCAFSYAGGAEFYRKKDNPGPVSEPVDAFELRNSSSTALLMPSIGFTFNIAKGKNEN